MMITHARSHCHRRFAEGRGSGSGERRARPAASHRARPTWRGYASLGASPPERRRQGLLDDFDSSREGDPLEPLVPLPTRVRAALQAQVARCCRPATLRSPPATALSCTTSRRFVRDEALSEPDLHSHSSAWATGDAGPRGRGCGRCRCTGRRRSECAGRQHRAREGGYKSELPEDDLLPADLDPDPCRDAESIKRLPRHHHRYYPSRGTWRSNSATASKSRGPTIGFTYNRGAMRRAGSPGSSASRVCSTPASINTTRSSCTPTSTKHSPFYDTGDSVTGIEMKVNDIEKARDIARDIDSRLQNGIYHTMDWEELNHGLFTALRIQQLLMSLVLALIIVVAAFTVIATLIMVVLDKKKKLRCSRRMGASNSALLRAFLYQGRDHRRDGHRDRPRSGRVVVQSAARPRSSARPQGLLYLAPPRASAPDGVRDGRRIRNPRLPCSHRVARAARCAIAPRRKRSASSSNAAAGTDRLAMGWGRLDNVTGEESALNLLRREKTAKNSFHS